MHTTTETLAPKELARKEAQGLRGRFGADVWQRYQNASGGEQYDFLKHHGVPESRYFMTYHALNTILLAEGICPED